MQYITQVDKTLWALISRLQGQRLQTPSNKATFSVTAVDTDRVVIETGANNTQITLTLGAFQQTLDYLAGNRHFGQANAVEIRSSRDTANEGPLSEASRHNPGGQPGPVNIPYILPILARCQVVGVQPTIPTTTWLLP